jgi:hypothetical protein
VNPAVSLRGPLRKGTRESRTGSAPVKAMEDGKNLDGAIEELLGIEGAECCDSKR